MQSLDIILASASPRREELLSLIFNSFRIIPSEFDESKVPTELTPPEHVQYSSLMKARDVAERYPDSLIIGADTIVVVDNTILGKPANAADAARMLKMLNNRTHQVMTGVTIIKGTKETTVYECTDVNFRNLSDDIISRYIATEEPMDKAGAYAIQGKGSVLISGIKGCYFNVVGLPLYKLSLLLEEFGVPPLNNTETMSR